MSKTRDRSAGDFELTLWGKTKGESGDYHPLYCHLLDVGFVAHVLLSSAEARHIVARFQRLLGIGPESVAALVAFLVALHDIGKASPSFQVKSGVNWQRLLRMKVIEAPPAIIRGFHHDLEAARVLGDILNDASVLSAGAPRDHRLLLASIGLGLGGHHGVFFSPGGDSSYPEIPATELPAETWQNVWRGARLSLLRRLRGVFGVVVEPIACTPGNLSALAVALCGLTILADWIGSDESQFQSFDGDLSEYPSLAKERAERALANRELLSFLPEPSMAPTFEQLFPGRSPRPLQVAVGSVVMPRLPRQGLFVVEAPMGEGKTEAALLLAARLSSEGSCRGFYFALPTMATSNQMAQRVESFLRSQLPAGSQAGFVLVHSQAQLSDQMARLLDSAHRDGLDPADSVVADSWLLPRKRSLLSPYGVGTVDQPMVAALNVKHGALRLFALASKVVIIDEVHAYDLYMSTILDRLLNWLGELGASVVILSATLPSRRRAELLAAFTGAAPAVEDRPEADSAYPLVTIAEVGPGVTVEKIAPGGSAIQRRFRLDRRTDGDERRADNAHYLLDQVREGGCVCWLCNTVAEAQQCFLMLSDLAEAEADALKPELFLFHARFPLGQRQKIEQRVLNAFGPTGQRPLRAIVVATQVVEQSLDLDFDLLQTQLAPVDLLLQRIGRVHRHAGRERALPLRQPRVVLLDPPRAESGEPRFGGYGLVYEPWILLKTMAALMRRDEILVPNDVRPLIEDVYDDAMPSESDLDASSLARDFFVQAERRLTKHRDQQEQEARQRLLGEPDAKGRFAANKGLEFDEDVAERTGLVAAQTRLGSPSIRAILLAATDPLQARLNAGLKDGWLDRDSLRQVLDHSVQLQNRAFVEHVLSGRNADQAPIGSLDGVRGLKGYVMITLQNDQYVWTKDNRRYVLTLSERLGVTISAEVVG